MTRKPSIFATGFREATPFIRQHREQTFVVYLSGEVLASACFADIARDLVVAHGLGVRLVLVHGARPQIDERLAARSIAPQYVGSHRVTDAATLEAVRDAVGAIRVQIESQLTLSRRTGQAALHVVSGNLVSAAPLGVIDGIDHQRAGRVRNIEADAIGRIAAERMITVLSPLGTSITGELYNIRSDDLTVRTASALARTHLGVSKVISFVLEAELEGLPERALDWPTEVSSEEAQQLLKDAPALSIQAALKSAQASIPRTHLVLAEQPGQLLDELYRPGGGGLLITDEAVGIRQARGTDVAELLRLIEPLAEKGLLVRRSKEVVESELDAFVVFEVEKEVVACATYRPHADVSLAEIGCIAVRDDQRGRMRGRTLLQSLERRAWHEKLSGTFVLTTQSADWFREQGYEEIDATLLTKSALSRYVPSRNSKVLRKLHV